jgi:hypothetical protein
MGPNSEKFGDLPFAKLDKINVSLVAFSRDKDHPSCTMCRKVAIAKPTTNRPITIKKLCCVVLHCDRYHRFNL